MWNRSLVLVGIDHATDVERTMKVAFSIAHARGADVHVLRPVPHNAAHASAWPVWSNRDGVSVQSVTLRGTPQQSIPAYAQLHRAALLVVEREFGSSRVWRSGRVVDDLARQSPMPLLVLPKTKRRERDEQRLRSMLTPFDFSVASAVALRAAADLSRHHGARVTVVHALRDVPRHMVFSGGGAWSVVQRLPAQVDAAAHHLRVKAAFFGLNDVDTAVGTGDADRVILEIASRADHDLIVMGIAHRSWLDRVVFGSTLRRVLRRAHVPVLVIPVVAGAHTWPDPHGGPQFIGVQAESAANRVAA